MKKTSLLLMMLSVYGVHAADKWSHATQIQMPNQEILQKKLAAAVDQNFIENTNIVTGLADQSMRLLKITGFVDICLHEYIEHNKKVMPDSSIGVVYMLLPSMRASILLALLENEPGALETLKSMKIYEPVE